MRKEIKNSRASRRGKSAETLTLAILKDELTMNGTADSSKKFLTKRNLLN